MTHMDTVPPALRAFFDAHPRLALAFSGGVDSAYLLYAARACGCDVAPFYARSAFQPEFERRDALRLAAQLGVALNEVPLDVKTLMAVFQRLVDNGATVIVIEHDLDVIRSADYVVDMGPGGGVAGGEIVATGAPEEIRENPESLTGRYL